MNTEFAEYELADTEYQELLDASKPVPYMVFCGMEPTSPRERAERIWQRLSKERGIDWRTIGPSQKADRKCFRAKPLPVAAAPSGEPT